jgi:multifunctional 2-oxoglutarate metabolism enzyme
MAEHQDFGTNSWLVESMREDYLADPASVGDAWRTYFGAMPPGPATAAAPVVATAPMATAPMATAPMATAPMVATAPMAAAVPEPDGQVLVGAAKAIADNMTRSLTVPTASSFRDVPAKLLEVNRKIINNYLGRIRGGKVSFTHIIGYAIVRAIAQDMPVMNSTYVAGDDGKLRVIHHDRVNLGLAVDVTRPDGSHSLVVPVLKACDTLSFAEFLDAYETMVRKVKANQLTVDDYRGATVSLTNPGTVGTLHSVPRLMPGQGVIVGVGAIDYPAEFQAADEHALAQFGVSKIVTISSTYDHRIIQGAESGLFLKGVHERLIGQHGFYDELFASAGVPYPPVEWRRDVNPIDSDDVVAHKQMQVATLIRTHRVRGHLIADLDPLRQHEPERLPELDPANFGLTLWDLDREFLTGGVGGMPKMKLGDLLGVLRDAYCRTIGIEYMHISDTDVQRWIQAKVEGVKHAPSGDDQRWLLGRLNVAEAFEKFLATKYVGVKRFGLEGGETTIAVLDEILTAAADDGLDGAVLGMAHRGRLNVLVNIVGKSLSRVFDEFDDRMPTDAVQGNGDVKYHLGATGKYVSRSGNPIVVELAANPSHLETVDPVVLGMVRARQDHVEPQYAYSWLPVLLHGDAAFAGQGVVAECLNMSDISGYRVGGTIHVVINNQVGFTTSPEFARSSQYCTDVAKMIQAPVFHVNGDDPEACVRVARMAYDYRQEFHGDVVIDVVCYRRQGHNEGDDPSYTQPLMYRAIDQRPSVRKLFSDALVGRGEFTQAQADEALADFHARMQEALDATRSIATRVVKAQRPPAPRGVLPHVDTGVDRATLDKVFSSLTDYPEGFTPHPKLARQFESRAKLYADGMVEWGTAELLAFGSLVLEGNSVRLAGEDSRRGTFSHRHACLTDYENGSKWLPLMAHNAKDSHFWVYDSLLSEYGAMGFEYGYSIADRDTLVLWEAQFGDFVNGAQIIIDQYLVAAEDKWGQTSGLVLLLPHGYEGQGPEHSSARIERFLTQCAEDNIQVVNATNAAQYFHVLRRQMHRDVRKPLVVFTPKSPLRRPEYRSPIEGLAGGSFCEVLDDPGVADRSAIRRVVFCSGKVSLDAFAERERRQSTAVAIVRVEQLFPFPGQHMADVIARYPNATDVTWLQEEPQNMGPWYFMHHRSGQFLPKGSTLRCVARAESGSPATGSHSIHDQELEELMAETFDGS